MKAEDRFRDEIAKCRRCEACRELLGTACLVFPKMFILADEERDSGKKVTSRDLIGLANLCNFCGICPCRDIRSAILNFKTEYVDRHGLKLKVRMIQGVERIGRLGCSVPKLANALLQNDTSRSIIQGLLGIHRERKFPLFPEQCFDTWWRDHDGSVKKSVAKRKVAYFAGCTARYFFPEVARATVAVLQKNGIHVLVPRQQCCGMPTLLEGDRSATSTLARYNVERWVDIIDQGYDILCSCPTCAYMLKVVISAGAEEQKLNRLMEASGGDVVDWPVQDSLLGSICPQEEGTLQVPKKYLERVMDNTSYFAGVDPVKRLKLSENTYDVGEYLSMLYKAGELNTAFEAFAVEAVYYPPCHVREQRMESPYQELLGLIPGFEPVQINGSYCCGNAGIMGYKEEFFHSSIKIAGRLISKIKRLDPELLTTECLSCRLQFQQLTSYKIMHPIEIIREAYIN